MHSRKQSTGWPQCRRLLVIYIQNKTKRERQDFALRTRGSLNARDTNGASNPLFPPPLSKLLSSINTRIDISFSFQRVFSPAFGFAIRQILSLSRFSYCIPIDQGLSHRRRMRKPLASKLYVHTFILIVPHVSHSILRFIAALYHPACLNH